MTMTILTIQCARMNSARIVKSLTFAEPRRAAD